MIDINQKIEYSEVYAIINCMGEYYKKSIPKNIYDYIEKNRDKKYNPIYDIKKPLSEQIISKKAVSLICMLHYNYWCRTENEKKIIEKIWKNNDRKNREKYDVNNIFKKDKRLDYKKTEETQTELIEYKENIFKIIIKKFKDWFKQNVK